MSASLSHPADRLLGALGALYGMGAVIALALASHALADPDAAALVERGATMALFHALAIFAALGLRLRLSASLFALGAFLFSAALYTHGFTGSRALIMLAPFGGMSLIVGWVWLFVRFAFPVRRQR